MKTVIMSNGKVVSEDRYIKMKTADLREFGYSTLTENQVAEQLEKIRKGEPLSIIGKFMENDLSDDEKIKEVRHE